MKRVHIPSLLCLVLLASAPAAAVTFDRATTLNGVYSVTFHLAIVSALPAGSTIICRAQISPYPAGLDLGNQLRSSMPAETAAGLAVVTGSTASCAVEIPFSWTVASAQGGVVLSYEIDAVCSAGAASLLVRSSPRQGIGATLPFSGQSASLSFNVIF